MTMTMRRKNTTPHHDGRTDRTEPWAHPAVDIACHPGGTRAPRPTGHVRHSAYRAGGHGRRPGPAAIARRARAALSLDGAVANSRQEGCAGPSVLVRAGATRAVGCSDVGKRLLHDHSIGVRSSVGEAAALALAQRVHRLHPLQRPVRAHRGLEPALRTQDPLQPAMITFDPVVQVLHPPMRHRRRTPAFGLELGDRCGQGSVLIRVLEAVPSLPTDTGSSSGVPLTAARHGLR